MTKKTMLRRHNVICAVSLCIALAACASGGGGGGLVPLPQPQPQPQPQPEPQPQTGMGTYWDTLVSGTVGRPARASFETDAVAATPNGPTFDGSSGSYAADTLFPATVSSLQSTTDGLSAVSPNQGATVSFNTSQYENNYYTLSIPSLNLDAQLYWSRFEGLTYVLSYVVLGHWADPKSNLGEYNSLTAFAFGYETPKTGMPTTGTASFSGTVGATVLKPVDGSIRAAYVAGKAGFSVDFSSGKIAGTFTDMTQSLYVSYAGPGRSGPVTGQVIGGVGTLPWNNVSVSASIAGGTNRFSGSTAATSAPDTPFSLAGSATGYIDGAFYGPSAENLGAVWSLSDGTGSAIGVVGAARQ